MNSFLLQILGPQTKSGKLGRDLGAMLLTSLIAWAVDNQTGVLSAIADQNNAIPPIMMAALYSSMLLGLRTWRDKLTSAK